MDRLVDCVGDFLFQKIWTDSMNRANSGIINLFCPIPTYGFAHAKVQKSIFNSKTLELVPNIGIILKDF